MKRNVVLSIGRFKGKAAFVWIFGAVLSAGLLFSACSKDDEGRRNTPDPVRPDEPVRNEVVFNFEFAPGKDLRDLTDITVTLTDPSGKVTTETVTSFPWKATVKGKRPCTAGYALTILPKDPLVLDKDIYSLSFVYRNSYVVDGTHDSSFSSNIEVPVSKDKLPETLEQMKDLYRYSYTVEE